MKKKIGFKLLFIVYMSPLVCSVAVANTALETAARTAFEDFQDCMRQAGDPTACEGEIEKYVERTTNLLRTSPNHGEGPRLEEMISFVVEHAAEYRGIAESEGDRNAAQKAVSLYGLLSKIDQEKASEYRESADSVSQVAEVGDLAIRLERHFPQLRTKLRNDESISERSLTALRASVQNYESLPVSLRREILQIGSDLDQWILNYLAWLDDSPFLLEVDELKQRIQAYQELQGLNDPPDERGEVIRDTLGSVVSQLNLAAREAVNSVDAANVHWDGLHSGSKLQFTGEESELKEDLIRQRSIASTLSRVGQDIENRLPSLSRQLELDADVLSDDQVWEEWISALSYATNCALNELRRCFEGLEKVRSFSDPALNSPRVIRLGERFNEALLNQKVNSAQSEDLVAALDLLADVDRYASRTYLDASVVNHVVRLFDEAINSDDPGQVVSSVIPVFASFYDRYPENDDITRLKGAMLDLSIRSLEASFLEKLYLSEGLSGVWSYLNQLPGFVEMIDSQAASSISEIRYEGLVDAQIYEVDVLTEMYESLTSGVRFRDISESFEVSREMNSVWARLERENCTESFTACRTQARFLENAMNEQVDGLEQKYREALPINAQQQREIVEQNDFLVCMLHEIIDGAVSGSDIELANLGFEEHEPSNVLFFEYDSALYRAKELTGYGSPLLIPASDEEKYNFNSVRGVIDDCTGGVEVLLGL